MWGDGVAHGEVGVNVKIGVIIPFWEMFFCFFVVDGLPIHIFYLYLQIESKINS